MSGTAKEDDVREFLLALDYKKATPEVVTNLAGLFLMGSVVVVVVALLCALYVVL